MQKLIFFVAGVSLAALCMHRGFYSDGYYGTARDMIESQSGHVVFVIGVDENPKINYFHRPDGNAGGHWDEILVVSTSPEEAQEIRDTVFKLLQKKCK